MTGPRWLLAGLVMLGLAVIPRLGQAQVTPNVDLWQSTISDLGCKPEYEFDTLSTDDIWLLASAFGGQSLEAIGVAAGYGNAGDYLGQGGKLRALENEGRKDLEAMLAASPEITRRMQREAQALGRGLCLPIAYVLRTGFDETVRLQLNERAYWQPHSELAQVFVNLRGCGPVDVDGFFGPASRTAWGRSGLALSAGDLPTPGDVARLASGPPVCGSTVAPTTMPAFLERCFAKWQYEGAFEVDAFLRDVDAVRAEAGGAAVQTLRPLLNACLLFDEYLWGEDAAAPGLVARLAPGLGQPATVADAKAQAEAMVETFEGGGEEINGNFLLDTGLAMWELYGDTPLGWTGVALLLKLAEPNQWYAPFSETSPIRIADPAADSLRQDLISARLEWAGFGVDEYALEYLPAIVAGMSMAMEGKARALDVAAALEADPDLMEAALNGSWPRLHYAYGTLVLEGFTPQGRRPEVARRHFEAAARDGLAAAQFRLGLMLDHGLGGPADPARATGLYERAAAQDMPEALLLLAGRAETGEGGAPDWARAGDMFARALAKVKPEAAARAVFGRMIADTGFWRDGNPGHALLIAGAREALAEAQNKDAYEPGHWQDIAAHLGGHFADGDSGLMLDLPRAARWWRVAGDDRLAALLEIRPDLAATPDEAWQQPRTDPDGPIPVVDFSSPKRMLASADAECPYRHQEEIMCLARLSDAALGRFGPGHIAPAIALLTERSDRELVEIARSGRLERFLSQSAEDVDMFGVLQRTRPINSLWLIDLLVFYGDYGGAMERLAGIRATDDGILDHSVGPLRRQIARVREGRADGTQLGELLSALAARGDATAADFARLLQTPPAPALTSADKVAVKARFEAAASLPVSRALSNAARDLGRLEEADGNTDRAVELELIAMQADLQRHVATELSSGPIAAELARVCSLSRSSERLFALDARETALALAKDAVNRLQGLREDLAGLPEDLQLCFRDQVETHYRWLADLFISENRPDEASRVLEMLKSFESYQFTLRSAEAIGASFETLPVLPQERQLIDTIGEVGPAVTALSRDRKRLQRAAGTRDLTAEETAELERLNTALASAAESREAVRDRLVLAADAIGRGEAENQLAPGKSVKRYLRRQHGGKAVVLQYVVLPDRMGAVLTTPEAQVVRMWDTLAGEPFDEAALNAVVAEFRGQVQRVGVDPRALAQKLHDFLLPPDLMQEIEATGAETIILSPDRQLRYVPFAALYDGESWLAERFVLSHSSAGLPAASDTEATDRIAAFGMTQATPEFQALPEVRREVAALVQENDDDPGILTGTVALDGAFTRDSLIRSLVFSDDLDDRMGVVHLASHFKFGATEQDSFLLLGDGSQLSVAEFRTGFGMDQDLSEVALLTLSACETAFGATGADGRELESFAAVAQYQGAQNVLATLWPVADKSTAALMVSIYDKIRQGLPVSRAVAESQRDMLGEDFVDTIALLTRGTFEMTPPGDATSSQPLRGFEHPFFWAPFVVLEGSV